MSDAAAKQMERLADPFATPATSFFERGDRKAHLEKLRQLSQWARRVLLVTGPRSVGKSALYRQLSSSLEPRAKAARINGSLINSPREILYAMLQGFGLAAPADADVQLLQEVISEHVHAEEQAGRFCAALVDDADLLEPRALEQLVALAGRSPLRVVMFGEVRLVRAVERLAEVQDVGWHEIRLAGFTVDEVRAYLEWRLARAGYMGALPFTDAQVKELTRLSDGLPGRIDQMASRLLMKLHAASVARSGRRLPRQHVALVAVLLVVLTAVYLMQPASDPSGPTARLQSGEDQVAVTRIDVPRSGDVVAAGPADLVEEGALPDPAPASPPPASPSTAPVAAAPSFTPTPTPTPTTPTPAPAPARPAPATPAPAASPPPATAAAVPAQAGGRGRDARWVMSQPGSAFTVQLVSLSSAERAAQYVASQPDPNQFAVYRLQRDGRILHIVLYGSFATREQAEAAIRLLPASVGTVQPWIRPFAHVHEAARSALQQ
jgi:DamX protein